MTSNLSFSHLVKVWFPIVLGFVLFRLMAHIDLVMVGPFGAEYVADFGMPAKIMLLDMLAAFSIGPVAAAPFTIFDLNKSSSEHISRTASSKLLYAPFSKDDSQ